MDSDEFARHDALDKTNYYNSSESFWTAPILSIIIRVNGTDDMAKAPDEKAKYIIAKVKIFNWCHCRHRKSRFHASPKPYQAQTNNIRLVGVWVVHQKHPQFAPANWAFKGLCLVTETTYGLAVRVKRSFEQSRNENLTPYSN